MKKIGVILILIGIALFFVSIINAEKYHPRLGVLGSISRMEVVLKKGVYNSGDTEWGRILREYDGDYSGRKTIPLKYVLTLSTIIIITGIGLVILGKPDKNKESLRDNGADSNREKKISNRNESESTGSSSLLKLATVFTRGMILIVSFVLLTLFFAILKELIYPVIVSAAPSIRTGSIGVGIFAAFIFAVILFPGMRFAWKIAMKINFDRKTQ